MPYTSKQLSRSVSDKTNYDLSIHFKITLVSSYVVIGGFNFVNLGDLALFLLHTQAVGMLE